MNPNDSIQRNVPQSKFQNTQDPNPQDEQQQDSAVAQRVDRVCRITIGTSQEAPALDSLDTLIAWNQGARGAIGSIFSVTLGAILRNEGYEEAGIPLIVFGAGGLYWVYRYARWIRNQTANE
ncbi:MAG: hypothetical protein WB791_07065 [Waddliaceae bacterium]